MQFDCEQAKYSLNYLHEFVKKYVLAKEEYKTWHNFFSETIKKTNIWDTLNKELNAAGKKRINNQQDAIETKMSLIFNALKWVKVEDIKVVILGQDPTPQEGKAKGVAFLVDNPRTVPAVLNMLLEVAFEGFSVDLNHANVEEWLKKGVLLLNTAFTVPHKNKGKKQRKAKEKDHLAMWRPFTNALISYIKDNAPPSAWLLWGEKAKEFGKFINSNKHLIVTGRHPSPMGSTTGEGNTFFGGNYFNIANQFLEIKRRGAIDWSLSITGRNGLDLQLVLPTRIELEQRENEEQKLRNQYQQNQQQKNLIKQEITKMQQKQQETLRRRQSIVDALSPNTSPLTWLERSNFQKKKQTLENQYNSQEWWIQKYHKQLQPLESQERQIEESLIQNRRNQHHLRGLPRHLLKHNHQKQINAIDEELKQLR